MSNKKHPDEIFWGLNFRKRRSNEISKSDFLKTIVFFEHLNKKQIDTISHYLHERDYEENEFLFEANHPGAALFIIAKGEVVIESVHPGHPVKVLAHIKSGEFLGELALLDQSPRSASARAMKPTKAFALFRTDLQKLSDSHPEIACEIFKTLAFIIGERLKATNRHVNSSNTQAA